MLAQYHAAVLTETLGPLLSARALKAIISANLRQDSLRHQINAPHIHFDNCAFAEGRAYIEQQHALIAAASDAPAMWAAFGRLSHVAQDFYSHSNYVDLWLDAHGGPAHTRPDGINGLDPGLLASPALRSGYFVLWRDLIHYIPLLNRFAKKHLVAPDSHEAMNLDDPGRGPRFDYSIAAAKQRTVAEYRRAIDSLDPRRVNLFQDKRHDNG
ncbi:MAG: hypothetical protein HYY33_09365 [Chloroflexi bacterium]|nr:hypothetical protein [Chloroflexota bacterium]